ncbi:MAG: helix-turn-helix transcriptional regulator [Terrabacter sp.]
MRRKGWTFLSNHGHVLVCLSDDPDVRLKDMAASIGITERAVQQIIADLEDAQVITRHKQGRRNRYVVRRDVRFRHPLVAGLRVGEFLDMMRGRPGLGQLPQPWGRESAEVDDLERDAL